MREEKLYKLKEAEIATGIRAATMQARRIKLGIPANRKGYTVSQIKLMLKKKGRQQYSKRNAEELRQILKNDGAI